jgi:hypothetical protein
LNFLLERTPGGAPRGQDAAKAAALRKVAARYSNAGQCGRRALKVRSELEIGRRLAFVLELIARGEVKAKMPEGAPLLDGLEVPERDLAGREFATRANREEAKKQ